MSPLRLQTTRESISVKRLIRNVANNVNQVAHRSNYLQVMVDEHELLSQIQRLETIVTDFVKGKTGQ